MDEGIRGFNAFRSKDHAKAERQNIAAYTSVYGYEREFLIWKGTNTYPQNQTEFGAFHMAVIPMVKALYR